MIHINRQMKEFQTQARVSTASVDLAAYTIIHKVEETCQVSQKATCNLHNCVCSSFDFSVTMSLSLSLFLSLSVLSHCGRSVTYIINLPGMARTRATLSTMPLFSRSPLCPPSQPN